MLIVLLSLQIILPSGSAVESDENWTPEISHEAGHHSLRVEDPSLNFGHSQLQAYDGWNWYLCKSLDDLRCKSGKEFSFRAIFPVCFNDQDTNCIRSITALHTDGRIDEGTFESYTKKNHPNSFEGVLEKDIPDPKMPSRWVFANTPHAAGKDYAIEVGLSGDLSATDLKANTYDFSINFYPVSVIAKTFGEKFEGRTSILSECYEYKDTAIDRQYVGCNPSIESEPGSKCVFELDLENKCLKPIPFPEGVRFRVAIDLSREPNGWFHGRMRDPDVDLQPLGGGGFRLEIEALPIRHPIFYWAEKYSKMSAKQKSFWDECMKTRECYAYSRDTRSYPSELSGDLRTVNFKPSPTGWANISILSKFLKIVEDKAVATSSSWKVRTLSSSEMIGAQSCYKVGSGVRGIVTTNSTVYSEGPPLFDGTTLQYRLAAPHLTPTNEEFRGSYNLVMRSDVARCLYGFTNAPIAASIEVIDDGGEKTVATTAAGERKGWLYLAAHDFTFSAPTIRMKLSQIEEKAVVVKSQIRCSKGNKIRKVTDVKPKCPKGWKKI